jgi:hypothetical protein
MTGTMVGDTLRDGLGELTIININDNSKMDALAALTDSRKEPPIKVFMRAAESSKISGIADGSDDMYFRLGNRWRQDGPRFSLKLVINDHSPALEEDRRALDKAGVHPQVKRCTILSSKRAQRP